MRSFIQDVRFGFRLMRRSPGFTTVAVLVLTVAIGGTAAMFNIINALVLKPLPVKEPEQLVRFYNKEEKPSGRYRSFSYGDYTALKESGACLDDLLAFTMVMVGSNEGEATRRTFAGLVSANYFDALGVPLHAGRAFSPDEEAPGSPAEVAVVSYDFWKRRGADPDFLGKTIRINSRVFKVIGIAPKYFTGTTALFSPEFWLPLSVYDFLANDFMNEDKKSISDRNHHPLMLVGRLKPGVTSEAAEPQLQAVASQLAAAFPDSNKDYTVQLGGLNRFSVSTYPQNDSGFGILSVLLMAMSGAVLLIACLNIANMLLARSAARKREIAVRLAMGCGRARLVRQLLTEGLLLALLGGIGGLWLASWGSNLVFASLGTKLSFVNIVFDPAPDWRVLAALLCICTVSVLLFGLGPAWQLSRSSVVNELKEVVGDELSGKTRNRWFSPRNALVVAQLAVSLALLTAAGLVTRGAVVATQLNPGFSFDHALLVETDASLGGYDEAKGKQVYGEAVERLRAIPGVGSVSIAHVVPFGLYSDARQVQRVGGDDPSGPSSTTTSVGAGFNVIGKDYFKTLGIPLLRGRDFDTLEVSSAPAAKVAIIDEPLARELFKEEDPVGRHVECDKKEPVLIVGVVAGVRNELDDKHPRPHIYLPFGQQYRSGMNIHIRLAEDAASQGSEDGRLATIMRSVQTTLRSVDPQFPILNIQTFRQFHEEGLRMWFVKTAARLFTLFGVLALFLAVVGVYGVKSYLVARRTREIGIRIAMGATRQNVLWMVLGDGLRLTAIGLGVGMLLALGVGFLLRSQLFGLSAVDPVAFTVAPICLLLAALIACYLPARRATRVQPMAALRYE